MMKKWIRITALILVLVTVFSFTCSANDYSSRWTSILDFSSGNGNSNTVTIVDSASLNYLLPESTLVRSVQGLFQFGGSGTIDSVSVSFNTNVVHCNVLHLGNGVYRFYSGSFGYISSNSVVNFSRTGSGTAYIEMLEFEYTDIRSIQYQEKGSIYVTGGGLDSSYSASMSSVSSPVSCNFPNNLDSSFGFSAQFFISDWKKYDYIDFWISGYVREISSVTAGINGIYLPCSVTELPVSGSDTVTSFSSIIRVDLRSIDRTSTYTPMIVVSGFAYNSPENVQSSISLKNVVGIVGYDDPDPMYSYLRLFVNGFNDVNDILSGIHDQTGFIYELEADWFSQINTTISDKISALQTKLTSLITGFRTSMETWAGTISGKLDQLIGSTTEGDKLSDGAQELEDQFSAVQDFEQSQQEVLDNNFDTILDSVSVGRFSAALSFVQRYINMSWLAIADFSIIYTLPLFVGIFFFICGRLPGATRPKYRPPNNRGGRSNNRGGRVK